MTAQNLTTKTHKTQTITARVSPEFKLQLLQITKERGITLSELVSTILSATVDENLTKLGTGVNDKLFTEALERLKIENQQLKELLVSLQQENTQIEEQKKWLDKYSHLTQSERKKVKIIEHFYEQNITVVTEKQLASTGFNTWNLPAFENTLVIGTYILRQLSFWKELWKIEKMTKEN